MAKHTPGPWIVHPAVKFCDHAPRIGPTKSASVATALPTGNDETEANARLIAAAPELLEALKGILSQAERIYATLYYADQMGHRSDPAFISARAAIAKATGEGHAS